MSITMHIALPMAAVTFCAWCVYLGGLASLQANCVDAPDDSGTAMVGLVTGFSPDANCMTVFRYWWFVMSIELVVIVGVSLAAATGKLADMKLSFLGLFAVTTLLYIEASNSFLSLLSSVDYYSSGQPMHRLRTTVAGAIMTATFNAAMVVVLGIVETTCHAGSTEHTMVAEKGVATTAV